MPSKSEPLSTSILHLKTYKFKSIFFSHIYSISGVLGFWGFGVLGSFAELIAFFEGNQYNESVIIENLEYDNTIEYQVGQEQAMIAFQFVDTGDEDGISRIDDFLQYYFVSTSMEPRKAPINVVTKGVPCLEKYASMADDD